MDNLFLFLFLFFSLYLLRYLSITIWNFISFYKDSTSGKSKIIDSKNQLLLFWVSISYFIFYLIK